MRQVNVHQAKTHLSRLLQSAAAGETIIIARDGHPVAVLKAYRPPQKRRRLGLFAGQGNIAPDFDSLPPALAAAFEGEDP